MLQFYPYYPVLVDVIESTIDAAYLHGELELGYKCVKFFGQTSITNLWISMSGICSRQ